ncbi:hypothetical protein D3C80_808500 [compost metagenome]
MLQKQADRRDPGAMHVTTGCGWYGCSRVEPDVYATPPLESVQPGIIIRQYDQALEALQSRELPRSSDPLAKRETAGKPTQSRCRVQTSRSTLHEWVE